MANKTLTPEQLVELSVHESAAVAGGMKKLPFQRVSIGDLLTTADGEPVQVYLDGLLINSVSTGYAPK